MIFPDNLKKKDSVDIIYYLWVEKDDIWETWIYSKNNF